MIDFIIVIIIIRPILLFVNQSEHETLHVHILWTLAQFRTCTPRAQMDSKTELKWYSHGALRLVAAILVAMTTVKKGIPGELAQNLPVHLKYFLIKSYSEACSALQVILSRI